MPRGTSKSSNAAGAFGSAEAAGEATGAGGGGSEARDEARGAGRTEEGTYEEVSLYQPSGGLTAVQPRWREWLWWCGGRRWLVAWCVRGAADGGSGGYEKW